MHQAIRQRIEAGIAAEGHAVIGVMGDATRMSFSYTVGLTARFGYELLVCGLAPQIATIIMNDVARAGTITLNEPTSEFSNFPLIFKQTNKDLQVLHNMYVIQADEFYGIDVNVIQLVMSDRAGLLPGDVGFDEKYMGSFQPLFFK